MLESLRAPRAARPVACRALGKHIAQTYSRRSATGAGGAPALRTSVVVLAVLASALAAAGARVDPSWPAAWSRPYQNASALDIDRFTESPSLAIRVAAGELPPVDARLPADPVVVTAYHQPGSYSITLTVSNRAGSDVTVVENYIQVFPAEKLFLPVALKP